MDSDLELAFRLSDAADSVTIGSWSSAGVAWSLKSDGSPVTDADSAAERAVLDLVRNVRPGDGLLGEEVGEHLGTTGRRWIVDGIDGTKYFASGSRCWGTLIALEANGEIVVGVSSSPAQGRRWWATLGGGSFTGRTDGSGAARLHVSPGQTKWPVGTTRFAFHPGRTGPDSSRQRVLENFAGGVVSDHSWSHQNRVAEGELDLCVWFAGDTWDHAAPSIIVEEAGGRFSDLWGGKRLDTRTALYSNGSLHDDALRALESYR